MFSRYAGNGMLQGIQALRFFAALSIFFCHVANFLGGSFVLRAPIVMADAVSIFFCLSGFLMARLMDKGMNPGQFLFHRFLRIYPPVFAAVPIALTLYLVSVGAWPEFKIGPTLFMYPSGSSNHLLMGVQWTLVFEIFFYVVIAALLLLPSVTTRRVVIIGWAATIVVANIVWPSKFTSSTPDVAQIFFSNYNIIFISGMFAAWLRPYISEKAAAPLLVGGLVLLILSQWFPFWSFGYSVCFPATLLACVLIVLGAATPLASKWVEQLPALKVGGDASYGIYLMHLPIVLAIYTTVPVTSWYAVALACIVALPLSIVFGLLEYRLYRQSVNYIDGILGQRLIRTVR